MKRLLTLAALGLLLAPAAYAETAWGTISSANANTFNIRIMNSENNNNLPSQLTVTLDNDVKIKGGSLADLKSGDNVKLNLKEDNGAWIAKSVERVDTIPGASGANQADASQANANPSNANYQTGNQANEQASNDQAGNSSYQSNAQAANDQANAQASNDQAGSNAAQSNADRVSTGTNETATY